MTVHRLLGMGFFIKVPYTDLALDEDGNYQTELSGTIITELGWELRSTHRPAFGGFCSVRGRHQFQIPSSHFWKSQIHDRPLGPCAEFGGWLEASDISEGTGKGPFYFDGPRETRCYVPVSRSDLRAVCDIRTRNIELPDTVVFPDPSSNLCIFPDDDDLTIQVLGSDTTTLFNAIEATAARLKFPLDLAEDVEGRGKEYYEASERYMLDCLVILREWLSGKSELLRSYFD